MVKVAEIQNIGDKLFVDTKRNFGVGKDLPPKKDLGRYVRWPKYIRIQRQRRVIYSRLKVPPQINQFSKTLDRSQASNLFRFMAKYRPEDKKAKKTRMVEHAKLLADGHIPPKARKPYFLKHGINHITSLVENKKAKLVVIAHDVDPIEIVVWLPALCRKMDVPYCIVKSKSRLGQLIHQKTATAVALTDVKHEDYNEFAKIVDLVRDQYNDSFSDNMRKWGGGALGTKSQHKLTKARAIAEKEGKTIRG